MANCMILFIKLFFISSLFSLAIQTTDEQFAMIKPNDTTLPVIRPPMEKRIFLEKKTKYFLKKFLSFSVPMKNHFHQPISLSQSVAVTMPTPNQLHLVHPLEDTYRARYKSDYFPQNGTVRRPRYVADNAGNHYITLQV